MTPAKPARPAVPARPANTPKPEKLSWRDAYQMATSILMVVLGCIILARTVGRAELLLPALSGAGILALGVYRLALIRRALRRRGTTRRQFTAGGR